MPRRPQPRASTRLSCATEKARSVSQGRKAEAVGPVLSGALASAFGALRRRRAGSDGYASARCRSVTTRARKLPTRPEAIDRLDVRSIGRAAIGAAGIAQRTLLAADPGNGGSTRGRDLRALAAGRRDQLACVANRLDEARHRLNPRLPR